MEQPASESGLSLNFPADVFLRLLCKFAEAAEALLFLYKFLSPVNLSSSFSLGSVVVLVVHLKIGVISFLHLSKGVPVESFVVVCPPFPSCRFARTPSIPNNNSTTAKPQKRKPNLFPDFSFSFRYWFLAQQPVYDVGAKLTPSEGWIGR